MGHGNSCMRMAVFTAAGKKKASDPFARKDWYDIKAPTSFNVRQVGKTLVTRTTGTKVRLLTSV